MDTRGRFYCACPCVCWGGINWADVTYSALLGGLSSGVFELSPSVSSNIKNNKLDPNEVISGIWEDSPNKAKNIVEKSQLENVENVRENIYNINIFNSLDDPMQEVTGVAEKSHPIEVEKFKKEIEKSGVVLKRSSIEKMGYAPGLKKGEPGVLYISDNASFSAWCHEMQHMRDDKSLGWCGMSIIIDPNLRFEWETKAYSIEIELAKKLGRKDIVKRLKDNLEKERKKIYGE